MSDNPASWQPDPTGRHEHRYWDGSGWTDHVADGGVASTDAMDGPALDPTVTQPGLGSAPTEAQPVVPDPTATRSAPPEDTLPPPDSAGGSNRSPRNLWIGAGVLGAIALIVLGFLLFGGDDDDEGETTGDTTEVQEDEGDQKHDHHRRRPRTTRPTRAQTRAQTAPMTRCYLTSTISMRASSRSWTKRRSRARSTSSRRRLASSSPRSSESASLTRCSARTAHRTSATRSPSSRIATSTFWEARADSRRSAAAPLRCPLLGEGCDALGCILGVSGDGEQRVEEPQRRVHVLIPHRVEGRPAQPHGDR